LIAAKRTSKDTQEEFSWEGTKQCREDVWVKKEERRESPKLKSVH